MWKEFCIHRKEQLCFQSHRWILASLNGSRGHCKLRDSSVFHEPSSVPIVSDYNPGFLEVANFVNIGYCPEVDEIEVLPHEIG